MHGYLSLDIVCSKIQKFCESEARGKCEPRGTNNVQGQIYEDIFTQYRGFCVYHPSKFCNARDVYERLTPCYVGCYHLSVLWNDFKNEEIFPFFCNKYITLSHLELNFKGILSGGNKVGKLGDILGYSPF